jgi:hypothetical protein
MSEIEGKDEIYAFIQRRKAKINHIGIKPVETAEVKHLPWYRRPLDKSEFRYKLAKNGRYYVRHKEWGNTVWIGPYTTVDAVEKIIESYVVESLKDNLDKKTDSSIHSVIIDNPEEFF